MHRTGGEKRRAAHRRGSNASARMLASSDEDATLDAALVLLLGRPSDICWVVGGTSLHVHGGVATSAGGRKNTRTADPSTSPTLAIVTTSVGQTLAAEPHATHYCARCAHWPVRRPPRRAPQGTTSRTYVLARSIASNERSGVSVAVARYRIDDSVTRVLSILHYVRLYVSHRPVRDPMHRSGPPKITKTHGEIRTGNAFQIILSISVRFPVSVR